MVTIQFGSESAEFLRLMVYGREHIGATDYWDGNWLSATAEVAAGAFRGTLGGSIRGDEVTAFSRQLESLYDRLDGEACFLTMESWVEIRVTANRRGHVEVHGRLTDDMVDGNTLEFRLSFDQTFLPPIIAQLHEVTRQFPVVGEGPVRP